jgi:hypothetical protein
MVRSTHRMSSAITTATVRLIGLRRRRVGEGEGAAFAFMPVLYVGNVRA